MPLTWVPVFDNDCDDYSLHQKMLFTLDIAFWTQTKGKQMKSGQFFSLWRSDVILPKIESKILMQDASVDINDRTTEFERPVRFVYGDE